MLDLGEKVDMTSHHVELLGDASPAQLLHAVADVAEAGVVVVGVLLGKVIYVPQRTILERDEMGAFKRDL